MRVIHAIQREARKAQRGEEMVAIQHRKAETVKHPLLACGSEGELDEESKYTVATRASYEREDR